MKAIIAKSALEHREDCFLLIGIEKVPDTMIAVMEFELGTIVLPSQELKDNLHRYSTVFPVRKIKKEAYIV